jgi:acyl-CoA reductase-like NAD-dependent aldehyde dehydrogenase
VTYFGTKAPDMVNATQTPVTGFSEYDAAMTDLVRGKDAWAKSSVADRIQVLVDIKDALMSVAQTWVETASRKKLIPPDAPAEGEEWTSGPYAVMTACNGLIETLSGMDGKAFLKGLPTRQTVTGQLAVKVAPHNIWDHLLLSGVRAEVWMQPGVTKANLADHTATAYDIPVEQRIGKVALVLGAGNIASIAPLDCFQKLFFEHQVVILKLNPVNDYLYDVLNTALAPLIARDALRIVCGDGAAGAYLSTHSDVDELHITGAGATHDLIVWGAGPEGAANKKAGTPINIRRMTSELGAVCPTIVVPGPWSDADIQFQAEHIATQKMHNSGFNCIACQVLVMPKSWDLSDPLLKAVKAVISKTTRQPYYPGAEQRMDEFAGHSDTTILVPRGKAKPAVISKIHDQDDTWFENTEIFAPAISVYEIQDSDPETYLKAAISYANDRLHGTLGGNILIHPKTIKSIGKQRFEQIISEFRYGTVAINAWSGLGFSLTVTPWGAFPGHTLKDVQSGIGTVHNTFMFDASERTVIQAPWRPFPRSYLAGEWTMLPKPPWFVTNKMAHKVGKAMTRFQYKPSLRKLPALILAAVRG